MIHLATDPNASRSSSWRPAAAEARENPLGERKGRSGHPWPFIAREAERPNAPPAVKRHPTGEFAS